MASEIRVNSINNRSGLGTVTIADDGIVVSGIITATTFSGNVNATSGITTFTGLNVDNIVITGVTTVSAGSTSAPSITPSGDSNTGIFFPSADTIAFTEGGVEAARFDSSGRLLVGTSSARSNFYSAFGGYAPIAQIETVTAGPTGLSIYNNNSSGYFPKLVLGISAGSSLGSNNLVADTNTLGVLSFQGSDGSKPVEAATIKAVVDGTPGADDMPGRLVFSTTADGASSPTERMRITNGGAVTIGVTTPETSYMLTVAGDAPGGGAGGIAAKADGVGDANFLSSSSLIGYHYYGAGASSKLFYVENDGDVRNSNNSYGAVSDQKLKQDIEDAASQWQDIKSLQVRKFRFKANPGEALHIGLIAQEVEQISPGLIDESLDRDKDGNETGEITKSVKYSVLYMKAVKALQEAMERIETLEAKVAALESA